MSAVASSTSHGRRTGGRRSRSGKRVRVAHVALQLHMGGMEKLLVEFARHADRSRFDLHFVALGGLGAVAEEIEALGWPVEALEEPPGLRPGLALRLASLFRRLRLDAVHTHNTKPLLYGAPAARLARVPTVIHTRHGQRFEATGRDDAVFKFFTGFVDRVACVSEDSERLSLSEGIPSGRLCTIWNGIDLSRFAYRGPSDGGPVVTVGRLSPEKDVANLVRAAAVVAREWPSFRLEIAGDGPCMGELRQLNSELGLDGNVKFLGQVSDVPGLLSRASLFVLPSMTEGISLTLLEAMARGLPIVTTAVGGNPEVVADGETGLLVPAKDPEALARAILKFRGADALGRKMGVAARRRVETHFDVRRMVRRYEALHEGAFDEKQGRGAVSQGSASDLKYQISDFGAPHPCPLP